MNTPTTTPHTKALTFEGLVAAIGQAHVVLAQQATKAVNISLTLRNWSIGFYIAAFLHRAVEELAGSEPRNA